MHFLSSSIREDKKKSSHFNGHSSNFSKITIKTNKRPIYVNTINTRLFCIQLMKKQEFEINAHYDLVMPEPMKTNFRK